MTETVTFTHHATKPEYQWEMVVPEGPTVLLKQEKLGPALHVLTLSEDSDIGREIQALPNGGSRSVTLELQPAQLEELEKLGVKTVMQS